MYSNTPNPKNIAAKITSLLCLIMGSFMFIVANSNSLKFPWIAQLTGLILITVSIYVASAFLLRQYTFSIQPSDLNSDDTYEKNDFCITEKRSSKNFTVCRISLDEIVSVKTVYPQNKKQIMTDRKKMKRFTYNTEFAASRQIEVVCNCEGELLSILITYDEKLLKILSK